MCVMIDAVLVLRGARQWKSDRKRRGWTEERPMHKIGGATGADLGGAREKKEREEGENKRCQFADERLGSQKAI